MNITLQLQGQLAAPEQMKAAGQSMVLGGQVLKMGVFAGILTGALSGYSLISVTGMNLTYSACYLRMRQSAGAHYRRSGNEFKGN